MAKKLKKKSKVVEQQAGDDEAPAAKKGGKKADKPVKKIKKADKGGESFDIVARAPAAPIYIYGHVEARADGSVLVNYKKPRSSKRLERVFSPEQVCGYSVGAEGEKLRDGGFVIVHAQDNVVDDVFTDVTVTGNKVKATDGKGRACVYFTGRAGFDLAVTRQTD